MSGNGNECKPLVGGPGNRSVSVKPQNLVRVPAGGGDWVRQAEHPEVLFLALGPDAVQRMVDEGDRDAQFSQGQGLTLVHFSAQRKHILWDTMGA